jgi:hypothetical protein
MNLNDYSLLTGDSSKQLSITNIKTSYEDYSIGNPYNTSFTVRVTSGDFSGISEFEYNIKDFRIFVSEIKELYEFKRKVVELNDIGYGSYIIFKLDKTGHIEITGTIYGTAMEHSLTFKFLTGV